MVFCKKKTGYELIEEEGFDDNFEDKNCEIDNEKQLGRTWIWTAIDAKSRLLICYRFGGRKLIDAQLMVNDLTSRLVQKPLFVSDALSHYATALAEVYHTKIESQPTGKPGRHKKPRKVLDDDLDYAIIHKIRKNGQVIRVEKRVIYGNMHRIQERLKNSPSKTINTAYIERSNGDWRL
jgi:IS1 family transposase